MVTIDGALLLEFNYSYLYADWNTSLSTMALVTSLIPDSRHKADYRKIICPSQVTKANYTNFCWDNYIMKYQF